MRNTKNISVFICLLAGIKEQYPILILCFWLPLSIIFISPLEDQSCTSESPESHYEAEKWKKKKKQPETSAKQNIGLTKINWRIIMIESTGEFSIRKGTSRPRKSSTVDSQVIAIMKKNLQTLDPRFSLITTVCYYCLHLRYLFCLAFVYCLALY